MSLARHYKNLGSVPGTEAMLTGLIRNCTLHLSFLYEETGRYSEAENYHVDFANETDFSCIPELNKAFQAMAESIAPASLLRRANLCFKQGKLEEAEHLYLRALDSLDRLDNPPSNGIEIIDERECNEIVQLLKTALGDISTVEVPSLPSASEFEETSTNGDGECSLDISRRLNILSCLADVYLAKDELVKAEQTLTNASQLLEPFGGDRWLSEKVEIWSRQAEIHSRRNKHDQAEPLLKLCIDSLEGLAGNQSHRPNAFAQTLAELTQRHSGCLGNLH
jgi:tetratricopeptide (TPR) repeat protein